ncbi:MAG: DNA mismatch repair protein MutS [Sphaerochaetaceae bacterium]
MDEPKVTPLMVQYRAIKAKNIDKVLFFRLGDFYEMFDEDAVEVSRLLNLTLTHRAQRPMCGIPYHAAKSYIKRLLDLGKKIAICEQMQLTDNPRELAKREVIQIVTPATVVDDDFLDARSTSYVLAVCFNAKNLCVSYADITSGEFVMTVVPVDMNYASLLAVLEQVRPREILVNEDDYFLHSDFQAMVDGQNAMVTKLPPWFFKKKDAFTQLCLQVGTSNLKAFGFLEQDIQLIAGGALLKYLNDTSKTSLSQITGYSNIKSENFMLVDESSRKNLELLTNLQDGSSRFTLFSSIDQTITSGGTRLLKQWISFPLIQREDILFRQNWVSFYVKDKKALEETRSILKQALDLQRLSARIAMHRCMPQDLVGIQRTVTCFFNLVSEDFAHYQTLLGPDITQEKIESLTVVMKDIKDAINERTQGPFVEGQVVNDGYDEQLDKLRSIKGNGKELLNSYLKKVRDQTGITNLKLSYNKIIGHFLEVSKGQVDKVPQDFYRKQTLVNAERYTTDELIALETEILKSGFAAESREKELYERLLESAFSQRQTLLGIAMFLSKIDVLSSLALTALKHDYCRPSFVDEDCLSIIEGRHPLVEQQMGTASFVANSLDIKSTGNRFCLITGPNMAGKSTYLRQNALIVLLAQIGSYVPAKEVTLSPVDRLFCRVGASDNLARGESTFLVEMQEAALILRNATPRSLVIVDELGRGTSTQDGMSIAYAVMQSLISMDCKTLFATHYHELAGMDTSKVQLLTLKVVEDKGTVFFLRKVIPGVANNSYGLNVAKLAGIPYPVLRMAQEFQKKHNENYVLYSEQPSLFSSESDSEGQQLLYDQLRDELDNFDVSNSTPLEALALIQRLKKVCEPKNTQ